MRLAAFATLLALSVLAAASAPACSLGLGDGYVKGTLNVPECWTGTFDLQPDFFAAVPYRNSLQLRIQNGGDYETFSDGIVILVDDVTAIRPSASSPGLYGQNLAVALPPEVTPPGVPITPIASPAAVHLTLYLQNTCRTQNPALYAVDSVSLNAAGGCDPRDGGEPVFSCQAPRVGVVDAGSDTGASFDAGDATVASDASSIGDPDAALLVSDAAAGNGGSEGGVTSGPVGHSVMTFQSLFNGDPEEVSAAARLNEGDFKVYLADPREICPGGLGAPPPCRGLLEGHFNFYFERGRPAQPFP